MDVAAALDPSLFILTKRATLTKFQVLGLQFIKKETLAGLFSYEFCKIFKNTFFKDVFVDCFLIKAKSSKYFLQCSNYLMAILCFVASQCFNPNVELLVVISWPEDL